VGAGAGRRREELDSKSMLQDKKSQGDHFLQLQSFEFRKENLLNYSSIVAALTVKTFSLLSSFKE